MLAFSIITPCLNQAAHLGEALASVAAQSGLASQSADSRPDMQVEHVVVDGGSVDKTHEVWCEAKSIQLDAGIHRKWVVAAESNVAGALCRGMSESAGDVIGWLYADDALRPGALEAVSNFLSAHPAVDVVYGAVQHIDEEGVTRRTVSPSRSWVARLPRQCRLELPAVFFRRRLVEQFGMPCEDYAYLEGYEYWLRLANGGAVFACLPSVLGARRLRPDGRRFGNVTSESRVAVASENLSIQKRHSPVVSSRAVVEYAFARAEADGHSPVETSRYDVVVSRIAGETERTWNSDRRPRVHGLVANAARQVGVEVYETMRRPRLLVRFLPRFARRFGYNFLRRKIFTLRNQEPGPLRLPAHYGNCRVPADPPLISIVTPNLNQGPYLAETIRSVVDQQYPNLEYRVQDGGSTDTSLQVLEEFESRLTAWTSESDSGQANAINRGMRQTTGEIMAFLNSDDLLLPGSLAYVANYFRQHPEVDVVYGHRLLIDEESRQIGRWVLPPHDDEAIAWSDYIPQETMFWRRRAWERVGEQLDETFHFALDWDLILRFREAGLQFVRLPRFLGAFRVTGEQKTTQLIETVGAREMARLRTRTLGREPARSAIRRSIRPYLVRHVWYDAAYSLGWVKF